MKRKKPPPWRGKQANRVRYALKAKGHEHLDSLRPPIGPVAAAFVDSLARKNTQAMPPTHDDRAERLLAGARLAGLVHTPASLVPAEPAPPELWTVPKPVVDDAHPVSELRALVMLHVRGEGGHASARAIRNAVPARLAAWVDDALRSLRDAGQLQCLTLQGEHVWRLR